MKNLVFLVITIFFSMIIHGQEKRQIKVISLGDGVLETVDSLSYRDNLKKSFYYIESSNKQEYTGKAIVYYGINALDSINIENGYQNGWQKTYLKKDGNLELGEIRYLNQNKLMSVYNPINSKLRKNVAFCNYHSEKGHHFIEVIYKRSGKIIVKQRIETLANKSKQKYRFSTLNDLEKYFREHYQIYSFCKKAGLFGKPEIE